MTTARLQRALDALKLCDPEIALKMCAVIRAAQNVASHGRACHYVTLNKTLQELNNDQ